MSPVAPIGLSIASLQQRIVEVDDALLDITEWDRRGLVDQPPLICTHADDLAGNRVALDGLLATRKGFRLATRLIKPCGQVQWVELNVSVVRWCEERSLIAASVLAIQRPVSVGDLAHRFDEAKRLCQFLVGGRAAFGDDLFGGHPVEILLRLYREEIEARMLCVDQLAAVMAAPTTTALRWVKILQARGLVEVEGGGPPGPGSYLRLAARCESKLDALLTRPAVAS